MLERRCVPNRNKLHLAKDRIFPRTLRLVSNTGSRNHVNGDTAPFVRARRDCESEAVCAPAPPIASRNFCGRRTEETSRESEQSFAESP